MPYIAPTISAEDTEQLRLAIASQTLSAASSNARPLRHQPAAPSRLSTPYSAVLDNGSLYLGNLRSAQDEYLLYKLRVTHVLSLLSDTTTISIPGSRQHKRMTLSDLPSEDLLAILPQATSYIDEVLRQSGTTLLVHCQQGVSRSASVVIGYLMMKRRWSLQHTLGYVKQKRVCAQPNPGFLRQLQTWEEQLFGPAPASML